MLHLCIYFFRELKKFSTQLLTTGIKLLISYLHIIERIFPLLPPPPPPPTAHRHRLDERDAMGKRNIKRTQQPPSSNKEHERFL